jgi:hypothetical protein
MMRIISIFIVSTLMAGSTLAMIPPLSALGHGIRPALHAGGEPGSDQRFADLDIPDTDFRLADGTPWRDAEPVVRGLPVSTNRPPEVSFRFLSVLRL